MSKKRLYLRPVLKKEVMGVEVVQHATYLEVDKSFGKEGLKQVIRDGGSQFEKLSDITELENPPQYILLTSHNEEEGLMAVSLIAGRLNERYYASRTDEEELEESLSAILGDSGDEEDDSVLDHVVSDCYWEECRENIPVITFTEALQYFENDPMDCFSPFNNSFMMGRQNSRRYVPYWHNNRKMPICITANWGTLGYEEHVYDVLKSFSTNCQVYFLLHNKESNRLFSNIYVDSDALTHYKNLFNSLILRFTAEEVNIDKTRPVSRYYENVWKALVQKNHYRLARNFDTQNLLKQMEQIEEDFSYDLLEQIFRYAIRSKETKVLSQKDFDFMERFSGKGRIITKDSRSAMEILKNDLIGLEQVKKQVEETVHVLKFNTIRERMGLKTSGYHNVHVMLGAPGTAKTTVARLMGSIMEEEGLLPDCRYTCVNGAELKGMYVGHSAPKTQALFEENDIIVIDEAYSLTSGNNDEDSFSREAIAQLVIELENHATDKLVIFAGYGGQDVNSKNNKMKEFIDANPGIKSRINSTFYFPSYTPEEMTDIFAKHSEINGYTLPTGYQSIVRDYFSKRVQDDNFGNGREARSLFEKVTVQMANRLMEKTPDGKTRVLEQKDVTECQIMDIKRAVDRAEEENIQMTGKQYHSAPIGFHVHAS